MVGKESRRWDKIIRDAERQHNRSNANSTGERNGTTETAGLPYSTQRNNQERTSNAKGMGISEDTNLTSEEQR